MCSIPCYIWDRCPLSHSVLCRRWHQMDSQRRQALLAYARRLMHAWCWCIACADDIESIEFRTTHEPPAAAMPQQKPRLV